MSYYISHFFAENFRQFSKVDVKFKKGFNILTGPNGCGKTSILTGIAYCFSPNNFEQTRFNNNSCFWVDVKKEEKIIRVGLGKNSFPSDTTYRNIHVRNFNLPDPNPEINENYEINSYRQKYRSDFPLFIGTSREIDYIQIDGMKREGDFINQQDTIRNSNLSKDYGKISIKQWFINRYFMIDKPWAFEYKENWNHLKESLPLIAPFNSNFQYLDTKANLEPMFSLYGKECYLEELSSGFQAIFSIIVNIIQWIEATNVEGSKSIKDASGTVLIDELDLHLHPEWQLTLRNGLISIFPNIQFIVTSHSPHLLASAENGEIIIMERIKDSEEYYFEPTNKKFSGWNTDQILEDVMGVESLQNKDYERLIDVILKSYENKDIKSFKENLNLFESISHKNDSILQVFKIKLASLELSND
ncbi:AAA family ATPase [Acinetobacter sp. RIT698]|uniref:AAA family ATPase n=1 Tax=Acinetobacter sp. RIT698 TaxID=2666192 RepID=UPI0012ACDDF7|nr:AAA family ATPase [Acinetobacter sp. RIT698]MRT39599.1 AAA family ATPase [Acinetobacter sp. RIT698]